MKTVAFFNHKGGVGKTTLVYHLAWMYSELGTRTLAVDLDPQAGATSMFLEEEALEALYEGTATTTIYRALRPLISGTGEVEAVRLSPQSQSLSLVSGDLALSSMEDELSREWLASPDENQRAFQAVSAISRIVRQVAEEHEAKIVLLDVGSSLGALSRATLIGADYVVIPLAPDLYSWQSLSHLGPALRLWRSEWQTRFKSGECESIGFASPEGKMEPLGYVVLQHAVRADRPVKAPRNWADRIPETYARQILQREENFPKSVHDDPNCLAMLKNNRSLLPMAREAHRPMFLLRAADGAIGGHALAVQACYAEFKRLALEINRRAV